MEEVMSQIEYILTEYQFDISNIPQRLICILCKKLLRNACQTECGCKGCRICFKTYLENNSKPCPSNSTDCANILLDMNKNIYIDIATNKEILCLKLKCPFNSCVYRDLLKNMVSHIDNCEYKETICDQCLKIFIKKDKTFHDENICEMRIVVCQYCQQSMSYTNLNSIHLDINNDNLCQKYFEYCPNKCSVKRKVLLREHLQKCSNKLFKCPFNLIDCVIEKQNKENLLKHFEEEDINHLNSLIIKLISLEKEVENLEYKIKTMKEINSESFANVLFANEIFANELFANEIFAVPESKQVHSCIEESDGRNVSENTIFRNGSFIWKISNFSTKKQEAANGGTVSFISPPFYTNEFGYKLCLKIYPNGDGIGKNTHLSVFFVIMKGDFDDILPWPFKQNVTLAILDQIGNSISIFETFTPDVRSVCFRKPTNELNIASGSPKFISINNLVGNSSFCQNDTIYLKITVDN